MNELKRLACRLRTEGASYGEINKQLGIPKSTLSLWLKDIKLTDAQRSRLIGNSRHAGFNALMRHNKSQTSKAKELADSIIEESKNEIGKIELKNLKLIGTALYLGEGGKSGGRVDFTNSNPKIIAIMMKFFREVCEVSNNDFRIQLSLHPPNNLERAKSFWSEVTGISTGQFIKVNLATSKYSLRRRKNRLPYGTVQVRISSVKLFHKIQGWIGGIAKQLEINVPG